MDITKDRAQAIADRMRRDYPDEEISGPIVLPASHEQIAGSWIVSWEECPLYDWTSTSWINNIVKETTDGAFFVEGIDSTVISFLEV